MNMLQMTDGRRTLKQFYKISKIPIKYGRLSRTMLPLDCLYYTFDFYYSYLVQLIRTTNTNRFTWYHVIFQTGSFFAVQQQLFFGAIDKTEVQKMDIKIEVEVSSQLWLDQRPYFCPNQDPEAVFLDFDLSKLSKYQFFFCFGVYFSAQQTAFVCWKFQK